ncbi:MULTISPECIES: hypothetical protein [Cyanophyceae]|uniref:hypothetical protein n=1 Tax=Cyanophyceae TaxID=3028117 RepID=UPI0016871CAE|nr:MULTISPECIES: hypothetical protein [Cyanophyceae]MBD1914437.1 hypothetical protein [Phormidium sp. FACHB-77]MBD2028846.1 hypothetical protein [Phormidium sp. FACHB-322]MBD2049216.1 hypothetical protein [Leptolyngbya sp. FACHB-60]
MTTGDKAKRATVAIGPLSVDGFQMPDGSYRMSITGIAEAIGTSQQNASNFLRSNALKALQTSGYTPQTSEQIEVESEGQIRGQTRITAVPLDITFAFWLYQCSRGNRQAYNLVAALGLETLERRFDAAFGVERSESDRNALLAQRLQQTEAYLSALGEAYAEPDELREQVARLEQQLHDAGLEPWQLPPNER